MLRIQKLGINDFGSQEVTANDEYLSRNVSGDYEPSSQCLRDHADLEDGGLVASTLAKSWLNTQIRLL